MGNCKAAVKPIRAVYIDNYIGNCKTVVGPFIKPLQSYCKTIAKPL